MKPSEGEAWEYLLGSDSTGSQEAASKEEDEDGEDGKGDAKQEKDRGGGTSKCYPSTLLLPSSALLIISYVNIYSTLSTEDGSARTSLALSSPTQM